MIAELIAKRKGDHFQCQLNEQAINGKFNDAARDYKGQIDAARANNQEKPKRPKKEADIKVFGAAYLPLGFGKPPRSDHLYWLNEFCKPAKPFECAEGITLWWQSHELGDGFDVKNETSVQIPSRHNSSSTWTECFSGFAVPAGTRPPHQWYNQLPGHAERFLTWCAYPKRGTLRNLKKQKHWDKVAKEWEVQHIDFYAVSRIIVADNAGASALWWHWQHEKACRWSLMGFESACKEYWPAEGLQRPTSTCSYCIVPVDS